MVLKLRSLKAMFRLCLRVSEGTMSFLHTSVLCHRGSTVKPTLPLPVGLSDNPHQGNICLEDHLLYCASSSFIRSKGSVRDSLWKGVSLASAPFTRTCYNDANIRVTAPDFVRALEL